MSSVINKIAPCGLNCEKCFAYENGSINKAAKELISNLGNFGPYAERFSVQLDPVFSKYPEFAEVLKYFAEASCGGCRMEQCKFYKNCKVRACIEEKNILFCYECDGFPCDHSGLDSDLHNRSVAINRRIKEIGAEAYYDEIKDKARY